MKKRISYLFISFFLMVSLAWAWPPTPPVPAASSTQAGKVELATDAETVTGTSDAVVCTPGNIAAKMAAPGAIGGTTPAAGEFTILKNTGKVHHVLAAGSPMLIGGDDIATLTGVTISNASPSVLTKDATIDDGLAVGDAVIVNSGTNATVGTYIVASIVANTSVTLDRQAATGACTDGNVTYVNDPSLLVTNDDGIIVKPLIRMTDGTDTSIIKHVQETGLGGRLTLGLDETTRTMLICDVGDVDTDFGLAASTHPRLVFVKNDATIGTCLYHDDNFTIQNVTYGGALKFKSNAVYEFEAQQDRASGDFYRFLSNANIELTDADGEQSWMYLGPKINQSGTGAYNGLKIKVTETALGDGTTGEGAPGNNLILAGTSVDPDMFKVDNVGRVVLAESSDPAALADHAFLFAKDVAGTGNMFVADAAADVTQISSHNFSMFDPDPAEKFPWSFYAENKALGVKINVDMARMVRAVEALTGQTFIHYADMEKSVDLEAAYKAQWEREYIEKNTYEEIVSKGEAFEMVEVDERVLYDVEVTDPKTGKIKIRKQGKQIGEKSTGFELVDGEVKEKIEPVWETKKVMKAQLKENVRFETVDGKFYKKIVPTKLMAEVAAVEGFQFTPPAWMAEKLNASPEPM